MAEVEVAREVAVGVITDAGMAPIIDGAVVVMDSRGAALGDAFGDGREIERACTGNTANDAPLPPAVVRGAPLAGGGSDTDCSRPGGMAPAPAAAALAVGVPIA